MERTLNYYVATVKGGHVGESKCYYFTQPLMAQSKKAAAEICKILPRAKKGQKDLIRDIKEVSYEEYMQICEKEKNNPYKFCKNIQEQRKYIAEIENSIEMDKLYTNKDIEKAKRRELGTATNKRRYVNIYLADNFNWRQEIYELAV